MADPGDPGPESFSSHEYRENAAGEPGYRLLTAVVTVRLLPDPRQALYTYDLSLETLGAEEASEWNYDIPGDADDVGEVHAWDGAGGLQTTLSREGGGRSARLKVRLRQPVRRCARYAFSYRYQTSIRALVSAGITTQTVTYSDWLILNVRCDLLRVVVHPPAGASIVSSLPAGGEADGALRCEIRNLRELESSTLLLTYRRRKLGWTFWKWVGSAIGSGLVGALVADMVALWR